MNEYDLPKHTSFAFITPQKSAFTPMGATLSHNRNQKILFGYSYYSKAISKCQAFYKYFPLPNLESFFYADKERERAAAIYRSPSNIKKGV
jgi:hypothetical protein